MHWHRAEEWHVLPWSPPRPHWSHVTPLATPLQTSRVHRAPGVEFNCREPISTWDLLFRCSKIRSLISTMATGIFECLLLDALWSLCFWFEWYIVFAVVVVVWGERASTHSQNIRMASWCQGPCWPRARESEGWLRSVRAPVVIISLTRFCSSLAHWHMCGDIVVETVVGIVPQSPSWLLHQRGSALGWGHYSWKAFHVRPPRPLWPWSSTGFFPGNKKGMNGLWVGHTCLLRFLEHRVDVRTEEPVPELPPRSGCFSGASSLHPSDLRTRSSPEPEAAEDPSFVCFIQLFLLLFTASEITSP